MKSQKTGSRLSCKQAGTPPPGPEFKRILLVDDHGPTREEMSALLSGSHGLQVVAESDSGEDAIEKARLLKPDLVVMDIFLPGISGVQATEAITRQLPGTRVIALSNHCGRSVVKAFLKAGGVGYVRKSCAFEELVPAIETVLQGKSYMGQVLSE
ncbi:MAG: response regulator transcription factor [Kiritimatiellia bacterium]